MKKSVENRIWQHRIRSLLVLAALGLAAGACGSSGKGGHESSTPPDTNVTPPADDENVTPVPVPDENPVVPGEFQPEGPDVACSNCASDDAPDLVCTDCGEQFCGDGDERGGSSPIDLAAFWAMIRYEKDHGYGPVLRTTTLSSEVIDKAPKDECFYGLGDSEPMQAVIDRGEVCGEGENTGTPKANYAYIWGLTGTQGYIYAASLANTLCLVAQSFFGADTPIVTPDMVCEDGENPFGDWRPSQLMRIAPTPPYEETNLAEGMPLEAAQLLFHTTGIRSAGSNDDVVFFAGPGFGTGVNMFAFEAASGAFLGAQSFPEYNDIRRWARVGDDLYTAVGVAEGDYGGAVLRWRGCVPDGDMDAESCDLFDFEVVGHLDAAGAELVEHEGMLAAGTWGGDAGIWLSPPLGEDGLDASAADAWTKVFKISDYDPDPITVATTGMGAMASYQGKLFFGTMHVPLFATYIALSTGAERYDRDGDGLETDELLATYLGTHRSTAFFMGEDLGGDCPRIRLVYGERYLPIYDPAEKSYTIAYDCAHQNRLGQIPMQGPSGFGNYFNDYGWAAKIHDGALFYGMFDSSSVAKLALRTIAAEQNIELPEEQITALFEQFGDKLPTVGADLFRIVDGGGRAFAEVFDGFGNWTNYGVRNLLDLDGTLYAGTANPFNLNPMGGWELVKFTDLEEPSELHATFTPGPNGNDWWVETYVVADKLLTGVDARVNGGDWRSLELKPWDTFADNIHAVYGSVVEFRATAEDGSVAISPRFIWPTAEIAPDDLPFEACFQHVRGNSWWVETSVYANGPVGDVYARASGGDWMHLCPTDYDAYAASFYVPGGAPVDFKACPMSGDCLTSPTYPWPDSCSTENPE